MNNLSTLTFKKGILRFELTGLWKVNSFSQLLRVIDDVYLKIGAVDFYSHALHEEVRKNEECLKNDKEGKRDYRVRILLTGDMHRGNSAYAHSVPELMNLSNSYLGGLNLYKVSLSSPGWLEVFGNINPLKVISDGINEWRKQNTEREHIRQDGETERLKIRTDFAVKVLELCESLRLEQLRDQGSVDRMPELTNEILKPAQEFIENIAKDERIKHIEFRDYEE